MRKYVRKTYDEYVIEMLTSQGWELATTEVTYKAARANLKEYRENAPEYAYRLRMQRVKIAA